MDNEQLLKVADGLEKIKECNRTGDHSTGLWIAIGIIDILIKELGIEDDDLN